MINRDKFFAGVRTRIFAGHISQGQFDGLTRILAEWDRRKLTDLRWLSYMLATVFHETSHTMQPIREGGGEAYLRSKAYYPWVGEGLVQVTWETNHRKFGATAPGQLMTWPIALRALFDGMTKGMFTTKKLSDYFSGAREDWTGARKIVNGTDRAEVIAAHGRSFHAAIKAAYEPAAAPAPKVSTAAKAGAGAIVVATGAGAGGHDWIGGDHWITYLIIGIGFALVLLLGLVAALAKKPETIAAAAPPAPSPLDLPKEGWKPAPAPTRPAERLKANMGKLSSVGSAWDQIKADIAKDRADMKAEAEAMLAAALESEKQEAEIEASAPVSDHLPDATKMVPEPTIAPAPAALEPTTQGEAA